MINKRYLKDEELADLFKTPIIQNDNYNANSTLFIHNGSVIKIYDGDDTRNKYNISVINDVFSKLPHLKTIKELVLPEELLIYNGHTVGFSMSYIKGITLKEIIDNNLYNDAAIKNIFVELLRIINSLKTLPFNFSIGDLHEKNVIIDEEGKINIIDADSFIIDNNKLHINGSCIVGKYANQFYENSELERANSAIDHYSLLCIILNYAFKDIIENDFLPVTCLKSDHQFKKLYPIFKRVDDNFILTEEDIDRIFEFKDNLNYKHKKNKELARLIRKIQKET